MRLITLAEVALRSLFLESSWNERGQQNLGLAATIDPALRAIHPSGPPLLEARQRALAFFNTNPIAGGLVIGMLLKIEELMAAGQMDASGHKRYAGPIAFALASLGDAVFWQAWLPFCSLVAVWAILSLESRWWPLLLPLLFGLLALPVRLIGLYLGYRRGVAALDLLGALKITLLVRHLKRGVALLAGVSTVIVISTKTGWGGGHNTARLWIAVLAAILAVFALRLLSRKSANLGYWFPILVVLAAAAVALGHHGGLF